MSSVNDAARLELAHAEHRRLFHRSIPVRAEHVHPHGWLNKRIAVLITSVVGTMWTAYAFAGLSLLGNPLWAPPWLQAIVTWISQNFLQLFLLSVVMVGQRVISAAGDARQAQMFQVTEAIHRLNIQQLAILEELRLVSGAGDAEKDSKGSDEPR